MISMALPPQVRWCIDTLEGAGFQTWCVGGCVRDALLGLRPQDFDLCTAARPEEVEAVFAGNQLILAGKKHGTVAVILPGGPVEITTFRTEGDYADCRHPQWVEFVTDIQADLARRDFTVNAMAWSPSRGFADPFGGRSDLENRILRAVGDPESRFREDALRILRGARFAVKYGLAVEPATWQAMTGLGQLMDKLARERVFDELCKLLPLVTAADLLRFAPILGAVIPELRPQMGFDQRNPHHAHDLYTHTANVTGSLPSRLDLRWAGLLHDVGKITCFTLDEQGIGHFYGHAQAGAALAEDILRRLKAPTALREQVCQLVRLHMTPFFPAEKKAVRRWLARLGPEGLEDLLTLREADMGGKGTGRPPRYDLNAIRRLSAEIQAENACLHLKDLAVNGRDLMAIGIPAGKRLGETLNHLLDQVIDEQLPNEREALLDYCRQVI